MLFQKLRRQLIAFVIQANLGTMLMAVAVYATAAYFVLSLCKEQHLLNATDFVYWLIATASTVGYGDLSPQTTSGKWVTALYIIPVGLSLFGLIIAKVGLILSDALSKERRGLKLSKASNHCVIIGWNQDRTVKLLNLISAAQNDHKEHIVLVAKEISENPMPEKIEFIAVSSYTDEQEMLRSNLSQAARIIIDTPQDDVTLTTALFCRQYNEDCHKTVYFQEENMKSLLEPYCPNVEIVPSVSVELLARTSIDPGSSQLHQQLLNPSVGDSQFSSIFSGDTTVLFEELFTSLKQRYNATLIGHKPVGSKTIKLNPEAGQTIEPGDHLYYIADKRLSKVSG